MTISKIDLLNKKFARCMRGYCPEEVDLAMHDAAEALGEAADENRKLLERLADMERQEPHRPPEQPLCQPPHDLRGALDAGRRLVVEINENARQEAQRILDDARQEAQRIVADANLVKARVLEEIAELRAQRKTLGAQMRKLLEDHFRLLEADPASPDAPRAGGDFIFAEGQE